MIWYLWWLYYSTIFYRCHFEWWTMCKFFELSASRSIREHFHTMKISNVVSTWRIFGSNSARLYQSIVKPDNSCNVGSVVAQIFNSLLRLYQILRVSFFANAGNTKERIKTTRANTSEKVTRKVRKSFNSSTC